MAGTALGRQRRHLVRDAVACVSADIGVPMQTGIRISDGVAFLPAAQHGVADVLAESRQRPERNETIGSTVIILYVVKLL